MFQIDFSHFMRSNLSSSPIAWCCVACDAIELQHSGQHAMCSQEPHDKHPQTESTCIGPCLYRLLGIDLELDQANIEGLSSNLVTAATTVTCSIELLLVDTEAVNSMRFPKRSTMECQISLN